MFQTPKKIQTKQIFLPKKISDQHFFPTAQPWKGGRGQHTAIFSRGRLTEAKTTFVIFFQFNQFCTQAVGLDIVRTCLNADPQN